jgi:transcriptional regulator with XRE-family HTH domain
MDVAVREQLDERVNLWASHLSQLIDERRRSRNFTWGSLAQRAGVGETYDCLTTILSGHVPRFDRLVRILSVLELRLSDAFPLPDNPTMGQLLRIMRLRRGLTLTEVGVLVGVQDTQILRIERDLMPDSPRIPLMVLLFGVEDVQTYPPPATPLMRDLQAALDERGWNVRDMAEASHLDPMTIKMILRGGPATPRVAKAIVDTLDLDLAIIRPFDPGATLGEQVRVLRWYSGDDTRTFADGIEVGHSGYGHIVCGGGIGDALASKISGLPVTSESVQVARSRHVARTLSQGLYTSQRSSAFGRFFDIQCIALGVLPGNVAAQVSVNAATLRKWRTGVRPRYWSKVEHVMEVLHFSDEQRAIVKHDWT